MSYEGRHRKQYATGGVVEPGVWLEREGPPELVVPHHIGDVRVYGRLPDGRYLVGEHGPEIYPLPSGSYVPPTT